MRTINNILLGLIVFSLAANVLAGETGPEEKIRQAKDLPVDPAMDMLLDPEIIYDEAKLPQAVNEVFGGRKAETISLAISNLQKVRPVQGKDDPGVMEKVFLSRKVLQVFDREAIGELIEAYHGGNNFMRQNIIPALGRMKCSQAEELLKTALEDGTFVADPLAKAGEDEMTGMRVCDLAYNQLVLRNMFTGGLRTIGPAHDIEARDFHINFLKSKLKEKRAIR